MGQLNHTKRVEVKGKSDSLNASLLKNIENLNKLQEMRSDADIVKLLNILSNSQNKYIIASRSLFSLGHFLYFQARKTLSGVIFLNNYDSGIFDFILDLQTKDVAVALSFPRYNRTTIEFSTYTEKNGAKVISITDIRISLLNKISDAALFCLHESSSFFTSNVASTALVNAILSELFTKNYDFAMKNLEIDESLLLELKILGTKRRIPRTSLRSSGPDGIDEKKGSTYIKKGG
jgi:DNA-binding MurR/RpiR family transcriptional regulator